MVYIFFCRYAGSTEAREKETEEVAVPRVTKEDVKRRQKEHGYMSIGNHSHFPEVWVADLLDC